MDHEEERRLLVAFFASGKEICYDRNEAIIGYGEESSAAHYIVDGCIKVYSHTPRGSERIHYLCAPGELFPMTQLFGPNVLQIGFTAFTPSRIRQKSKAELIEFLHREPGASLPLLQQQALVHGRIVNLNIGPAEQRLVARLLTLSERFGACEGDHYVVSLPLTVQQLADMVRLTRETTGKVIAKFEQQGCIIFGRRQIHIYPEKLKLLLEE